MSVMNERVTIGRGRERRDAVEYACGDVGTEREFCGVICGAVEECGDGERALCAFRN